MVDIFILPAPPLHPLAARLLTFVYMLDPTADSEPDISSSWQKLYHQRHGRARKASLNLHAFLPSTFTPLPTPRNFESALSFL